MVLVNQQPQEALTVITLRPNRSLSWRGNLWLIASLSCIALAIGISFAALGAWVILPFSGLEILALSACLYVLAKRNARQEVITVSDNNVLVERGIDRPSAQWCYERSQSAFHIEKPTRAWSSPIISIRCQDQHLELGAFLNRRDKIKLINTLKSTVAHYNITDSPGHKK